MKILWEEHAWEEYLEWQIQDKKTLKRINTELIHLLKIYNEIVMWVLENQNR